ncbi:uncharacterized protein LOC111343787 [Stylophora pistillata]|uniref:uncharacterized protein LOC111343787 n=1 Tax=Stylophora pistillata TaxID=50429 RepID=UPI000C03D49F|nr:uncharacterized protein LOC111343787 [Stylophora pistillata]
MEQDGAWGDHVILCSAANFFETCIRVVSSLSHSRDVIITPHCPVDDSKPLVLGHIHELHYVSLQPAQDVIPFYVLARGEFALEAYQRGLQSGRTFDKRTKILLIGQDSVGKTSLGKNLRGENFNPREPSTDGVKMMPAVKNAGLGAWRNPAFLESTSPFDFKCAELVTKELLSSSPKVKDAELGARRNPVSLESTSAKLVAKKLPDSSPKVKDAGSGAMRNPASLKSTSTDDPKSAELFSNELLSSSPEKSNSALQFTEESFRDESTKAKKAKEESVVKESRTEELRGDDLTHEEVYRNTTESKGKLTTLIRKSFRSILCTY